MYTQYLLNVHSLWEVVEPPNAMIIDALKALPTDKGPNDYVILEKKTDDPREVTDSFLQARPTRHPRYEGVFLVEYRDGVLGRHFGGHLEAESVSDLFLNYRYGDPRWSEGVVWRDISYRFEDLHKYLTPGELTSTFFAEGEWEQELKDKAERDREFWKQWYGEEVEAEHLQKT